MNEAFKKNLEKKQNNKGWGIYTKVEIPAGTVVFEFMGDVLNSSQIPFPLMPANDHYLQIGIDKYLGPSGDLDDLINHSCAPNCLIRIGGIRAFLQTMYVVTAGKELTFDYSTTSNDDEKNWSLPCSCGTGHCRKIITGYQYLNETIKENYKQKNMIPEYIIKGK